MKGILQLVDEFDGSMPWQVLHWLEAEAMRVDEAAWAEAWKRVNPPEHPSTLPENVRTLLQKARPLLVSGR
ncbi:hypothetical protein ACIBAC_00055 [Streptomyces sp. NPDC051362]|uniref:hypothetical protein n=1 Tax=Streptomyces sp. NPDC051362 TaxID=3365651 RepID=UPI0037B3AF36